jgi:hypothetical protein
MDNLIFPYEIAFLIAASTIFYLLYRSLSGSIQMRKERMIHYAIKRYQTTEQPTSKIDSLIQGELEKTKRKISDKDLDISELKRQMYEKLRDQSLRDLEDLTNLEDLVADDKARSQK